MKKKPAAKKPQPKPATLPAIRLKPGTWVAMDKLSDSWFAHKRKPRPVESIAKWGNSGGCKFWIPMSIWNCPRIPKSQWNKHLFRVGRSGELIRVEVK